MPATEVEQERINDLASALIGATPEKFKSIDCLVEQVPTQCSGRYSYKVSCKDFPEEIITQPSDELHAAAYEAIHALKVEGIEAHLEEQDGSWSFSFTIKRLHSEKEMERQKEIEEQLWQKVYNERQAFFAKHFGPMPANIQKLMTVHWAGGGIWDIEKSAVMPGKRVMITCGLSNPDVPSAAKVAEFNRVDEKDGNKTFNTKLERQIPRFVPPDLAGYGYEVAVICKNSDDRAMNVLTWVVEGELNRNANYFGMLQQYGGLTVEDMGLFDGSRCDFIFYKAIDPIPSLVQLSNGSMHLVIATRITRAERDFAKENGCAKLVECLIKAGVGQVSDFDRKSAV